MFTHSRGEESLKVSIGLLREPIEVGAHRVAFLHQWTDFPTGAAPFGPAEPLEGNTPWITDVGTGFDCDCEGACGCGPTSAEATITGTLTIDEVEFTASPEASRPGDNTLRGTLELTVDGWLPRRPRSITETHIRVEFDLSPVGARG